MTPYKELSELIINNFSWLFTWNFICYFCTKVLL